MNTRKRYDNLSIIRMVACIMVLMVHLGERIHLPGMLVPFFEAGSSGVTLFFVLTGFLGMESIQKREETKQSLGRWYLGKCVRILPVYYVAILIYFVVYQLVLGSVPVDESGLYWFRYLFCINGVVPTGEMFWGNLGAVWTVSVFLIWYLITPLVHKVVRSFLGSGIAFVFCYALEKGMDLLGGWASPLKYMQYCMLGVVLYFAIKEGKEKILAAISVVVLYLLIIKGSDSALVPALITVIFACVTMQICIKNKFGLGVLHFFDTYSYGIYIMQGIAALILDLIGLKSDLLIIVGFLGMTVGLAILIHFVVEKPVAKLMKR